MSDYKVYPKDYRNLKISVEKNRCFFLMPFAKDFDLMYGTLKQYLMDQGYICNRVDEIVGSTPIITKILTEIMKAQYLIVDLTNNNPNVFYELGIAHTLKDASNIVLLKQRDSKVPFDITHLTYIEYDSNNLRYLATQIVQAFQENAHFNELKEYLILKNICSATDDVDNFVNAINSFMGDKTILLNAILTRDFYNIVESDLRDLLFKYLDFIKYQVIGKIYDTMDTTLKLFNELVIYCANYKITENVLDIFLNSFWDILDYPEDKKLNAITDLMVHCASNHAFVNISMSWIVNYFKQSKATTVDLNRYKLEHFLMTTLSEEINNIIINALCDSDCHVREHFSDMIGEKRLYQAADLLLVQLRKEENIFTATSMMEAIGKLRCSNGIDTIMKWLKEHQNDVLSGKHYYVLNHAKNAILRLDNTQERLHINAFENLYGKYLIKYDIL